MSIKIQIPEPCNENWYKMTPTEKGRFCSRCQKDLIDFTSMTNKALYDTVTNGEKMCGRFRKDQLNTELFRQHKKPLPIFGLVASFTSLLSFVQPVNAQNNPITPQQKVEVNDFIKTNQAKPNVFKTDSLITIKGCVTDSTGEAIPLAVIRLFGADTLITKANFDGYYEFNLESESIGNLVDMQVESTLNGKVYIKDITLNNINMFVDAVLIPFNQIELGVVGIYITTPTPTKWQLLKDKFRRKSKKRWRLGKNE